MRARLHRTPPATGLIVLTLATTLSAQNIPTAAYCRVATPGTEVVVQRPSSGEDPVDDRRGRLRRPIARQLTLRRERQARDAGAAKSGRAAS